MTQPYGRGVFRRRVRLENRPGTVCTELEDCAHGFRLHVVHDGATVTEVAAEALRIPLSTCMEASPPLKGLIACPLAASWKEFQRRLPASTNCTHLRDMAWWSMAHALRQETVRDYEVAITDQREDPSDCLLWRNGELVLQWQVKDEVVIAPAEIANRSLRQDFHSWAEPLFRGDAFEAAVMLQRAYLVSGVRRVEARISAGTRAVTLKHMHGVCYTYSPGAVERAVFVPDSVRDFTDDQESLLRFIQVPRPS